MKNIFYKRYTAKWQRILTIAHLIYAAVFTVWIILIREYKYSFMGVFIAAMILGIVLFVLQYVGIKKKA